MKAGSAGKLTRVDLETNILTDKKEDTATGPKIVKGSVVVDVPFPQVGTTQVKCLVRTVAQPVAGPSAVDEDEVIVVVMVMDPATLGSISGRVLGPDSPVAGAKVVALETSTGKTLGKAQTGADGSYTIRRLHPGNYIVRASKEDSSLVPVFYPNAFSRDRATPLSVEAGQAVTGIDFHLVPGGRIAGRVTQAGGSPLGRASVAFIFQATGERAFAQTQGDGSYISPLLPPGFYLVRAQARGFRGEFYDNVLRQEEATAVSVLARTTTGDINFELNPVKK